MYENVTVTAPAEMPRAEIEAYIAHIERKCKRKLASLTVDIDGEYVNCNYKFIPVSFERIRRITGYLTGTVDGWNNGKKAELRDRVTHGTEMETL
jgi:anaerobic ribonucleoside-triphosphate reductase